MHCINLLKSARYVFTGIRRYSLVTMASGKLDSPEFKALLTPDLIRLESMFKSQGYSLRLVGGAVRDLLLGHKPKDIDLATDCKPEEMLRLLEIEGIRNIPTGLQHGTVTAHMNNVDYEITTLRIDRITDGRHAVVEYTQDWKVDAERRDLTINSMSLGFDGTLYDYFNGQQHLSERKVLFVGKAQQRITEDYLRILRYFRFYGRIATSPDAHDQDTLVTITETAHGLKGISVERIWMEMKKILTGNHAPSILSLIYELGVADNVGLPQDPNMVEFSSVWTHFQSCQGLDPVTLLVSLVPSAKEAEALSLRWKHSKYEQLLGVFVASHREVTKKESTSLKYFQDLVVDKNPKHQVTAVLRYCGRMEDADFIDQWPVPVLPVTGNDLKRAGIPNGPSIGRALNIAKEKWKESFYTLKKDELIETVIKNTTR